ncbi:hypothetical protein D9M70_316350 [compost metagenome]
MNQQAMLRHRIRVRHQPWDDHLPPTDQRNGSSDIHHRLRILEMRKPFRPQSPSQHGDDANAASHLQAALGKHPDKVAGNLPPHQIGSAQLTPPWAPTTAT